METRFYKSTRCEYKFKMAVRNLPVRMTSKYFWMFTQVIPLSNITQEERKNLSHLVSLFKSFHKANSGHIINSTTSRKHSKKVDMVNNDCAEANHVLNEAFRKVAHLFKQDISQLLQ